RRAHRLDLPDRPARRDRAPAHRGPTLAPPAERRSVVRHGGSDRPADRARRGARAAAPRRGGGGGAGRAGARRRGAARLVRLWGGRGMSKGEVDRIELAVTAMLTELGEDPKREGLEKTPARVARSMRFLTSGYHQDPIEILNNAVFEESYDEMVLVKDVG